MYFRAFVRFAQHAPRAASAHAPDALPVQNMEINEENKQPRTCSKHLDYITEACSRIILDYQLFKARTMNSLDAFHFIYTRK